MQVLWPLFSFVLQIDKAFFHPYNKEKELISLRMVLLTALGVGGATVFGSLLGFIFMIFVHHGNIKPQKKQSILEYMDN